ncbi:MAG TPA: adenylate/guanylate cyclase domain-containing protein [Burkholderiales bacterium]|nr:adenylate/guanylate cyclase domain-containing protein [Burkholderiales bacterium]
MAREKANMAVLFADVSGSTRMYEALGDTAAFGKVQECLGLLKRIATAFGGRVVKTIGDGAMCVFDTSDAAAQAAGEMQLQMARLPDDGKSRLMIRIGFHFGPVIEQGDDVFGDSVNLAARLSGLAIASQVITSAETVETMSSGLQDMTRRITALPVKGKILEVDVHELMWQASSERTVIPGRSRGAAPASGPAIKLTYRGREVRLKDAAWFGRDADNTVVIADRMASRRHAKIEQRGDKFVLVDQSSNGTFVTLGGSEMRLRREEVILHGAGVIAFGHSASEAGEETVEFRCDSR